MSKHQDKSVKMTLSAPAPKAETDSNHSMRDTVSMHKRLSAERENAVLKTYFVLTQVQGLRGMPTYPGNHCAHTLPSMPGF